MGRNLSNLFISQSYQFITQISGSELQDGLGNTITGSLLITSSRADNATSASQAISASFSNVATSASYALVSTSSSFAINANNASTASIATSASYALTSTSASFANNATSASYAVTASFALNAGTTVSTASLLTTASAVNNVITFTKGDGSTFPVTVATGSMTSTFPFTGSAIISGSLGVTGSINVVSGSFSGSVITNITDVYTTSPRVNQVVTLTQAEYNAIGSPDANTLYIISGSTPFNPSAYATTGSNTFVGNQIVTGSVTATTGFTGSLLGTASFATSASQAISSSFATSASVATSASFAVSASTAVSASYAISASQAQNAISSSFATSASVATSASQAVSSSFATTASFAQNIASGLSPTFANVTASNVLITGTASVALLYTQTISSSVIYSSGSNQFGDASNDVQTLYGTFNIVNGPSNFTGSVNSVNGYTGSLQGTASFAVSASQAQNAVSASYAPSSPAFPFTGSAQITGSLGVTGSISVLSGSFSGSVITNITDVYTTSPAIDKVITLTQAEYNAISASANVNTFYVISDSVAFNPSNYATTGSNTFVGNQIVTGSVIATLGFTGSLSGTASFATSASQAISSSFATTASYASNFTIPTLQQVTTAGASTSASITINNTASADYWMVDTKPFAQLSTNTIVAGRIDGADEDFILAGRNYAGSTANAITMTDGEFIYNQTTHTFTGSVNLSSTLNVTGATTLKDDTVITGSLRGNVNALSISSQTASLDCSTGNFFTLLLVSGSTTFVNPSNILPGQTINLRVKQASVASGSISFASSVKQVSGSLYTPTTTVNAEDIVTFISFDSTNLYLSNIKNFV